MKTNSSIQRKNTVLCAAPLTASTVGSWLLHFPAELDFVNRKINCQLSKFHVV